MSYNETDCVRQRIGNLAIHPKKACITPQKPVKIQGSEKPKCANSNMPTHFCSKSNGKTHITIKNHHTHPSPKHMPMPIPQQTILTLEKYWDKL
jgi:hypothetical protein